MGACSTKSANANEEFFILYHNFRKRISKLLNMPNVITNLIFLYFSIDELLLIKSWEQLNFKFRINTHNFRVPEHDYHEFWCVAGKSTENSLRLDVCLSGHNFLETSHCQRLFYFTFDLKSIIEDFDTEFNNKRYYVSRNDMPNCACMQLTATLYDMVLDPNTLVCDKLRNALIQVLERCAEISFAFRAKRRIISLLR
jgi:hypothetical protein